MRRLTLILIAALAALALAACGGGSDGSSEDSGGGDGAAVSTGGESAEAILASAATNAAGAGSSNVDFSITIQVPQQEGPLTLSGDGAFNYETQQGELTYDFGDLFAATGQSLPGADEPIEIILDENVIYMKWGLLSSVLPGAKEWIKVDVEALAGQEGIDLSQLQSINQGDPSQILEYLRASGSVEEVGTEEVRGVETTHYKGVIDLDKVAELAPEDVRAQLQQSVDQLKEQAGVSELPVEVWVDGDGLPARIQYSFDGSIAAAATGTDTEGFTTIFTMELYDWGTDVTVEPPPASEVSDLAELTEQLGVTTTG
jgi:hypothetical protein